MSASVGVRAEADADRAARQSAARRPWPQAHARAAPCPTSRPRRRTPRPRRGRRRSRRSRPSCRGTANRVVFGSRSASAPKMTASGVDRREARLRAGRAARRIVRAPRAPSSRARHRQRRRSRRSPATFSVPARSPRSWPPPRISGSADAVPRRADQRADALGAADLVRRERQKIGAECADIDSDPAWRLDRVDMQQAAGLMHDVGDLANRLDDAGLVVGQHDARPAAARRPISVSIAARRDRRRRSRVDRDRSTGRRGNRPPASTEGCSIAETSSRSKPALAGAGDDAGDSASMLASVPPEVKTTSAGSAPTRAATSAARLLDQRGGRRGPRHGPRTGCRRVRAPPASRRAPRGRSGAVAFQSR